MNKVNRAAYYYDTENTIKGMPVEFLRSMQLPSELYDPGKIAKVSQFFNSDETIKGMPVLQGRGPAMRANEGDPNKVAIYRGYVDEFNAYRMRAAGESEGVQPPCDYPIVRVLGEDHRSTPGVQTFGPFDFPQYIGASFQCEEELGYFGFYSDSVDHTHLWEATRAHGTANNTKFLTTAFRQWEPRPEVNAGDPIGFSPRYATRLRFEQPTQWGTHLLRFSFHKRYPFSIDEPEFSIEFGHNVGGSEAVLTNVFFRSVEKTGGLELEETAGLYDFYASNSRGIAGPFPPEQAIISFSYTEIEQLEQAICVGSLRIPGFFQRLGSFGGPPFIGPSSLRFGPAAMFATATPEDLPRIRALLFARHDGLSGARNTIDCPETG